MWLNENEINVELKEEVAEGTYSNLAVISHSATEFVLDFAQMAPGLPKPRVKSRIILAPEHAKRLLLSLQENLRRYEEAFGDIPIHVLPHEQMPIPVTPVGEA